MMLYINYASFRPYARCIIIYEETWVSIVTALYFAILASFCSSNLFTLFLLLIGVLGSGFFVGLGILGGLVSRDFTCLGILVGLSA
jgi:hypothetical protein